MIILNKSIPEGWKTCTLSDIGKLTSGFALKSEFFGQVGTKVLIPKNFTKNGKASFTESNTIYSTEEVDDKFYCRNGDLLILLTDLTLSCELLGRPVVLENLEDQIILNQRIVKVEVNENVIDKIFLSNYFLSHEYLKYIKRTASGSTVRHSSNKTLLKSIIPLPPLPEQKKIAQVLTTWDTAIEKTEQLLTQLRRRKQGLMQWLLSGKQRLPGFMGAWEEVRLGEVLEKIVGGGTPSKSNAEYWNGEIYWATVKDFATFNPLRTQDKISIQGLKNSSSNLIPKGTLITATRMGLGRIMIYEIDVAINQDLKAVFPKSNLSNDFLFYWFKDQAEYIESLGTGSTVKGITLSELRSLRMNLPSLEEQCGISKLLLQADQEIDKTENYLDKLREQKKGLMQELLTGQRRVKV